MLHEVDLLIQAADSSGSTTPQPVTDLEILESSLNKVSDMLDRVLVYVRAVIAGERKGDASVGRYLMDALGTSTEDLEKGGFNSSLQVSGVVCVCVHKMYNSSDSLFFFFKDTLMITYLASLVRSQAEVSARLALTSV